MYKFMQIYGNCLDLFILTKEERINGPVDNVLTKNRETIKLLLTNKYLEHIKTANYIESERPISFVGDSPVAYDTDLVRIVHNNPKTDSYIKRTKERCENLKNFLKQLKTNTNYFLIYSINNFDINRKTHTLRGNNFINNIKLLKEMNLLNKTIFIGTIGKVWTNFWSNELIPIIKKYNLKYLEILDIKSWKDTSEADFNKLHNQFKQKLEKLLLNGVDQIYLQNKLPNGKYRKIINKPQQTKKEEKQKINSYLGNGTYYGL